MATKKKTQAKKAPLKRTAKKAPAKKETRRRGRPSLYSTDIAEEITRRLFTAEGDDLPPCLNEILEDPKLPSLTTVHRWLTEPDKQEFRELYARARELRMDRIVRRIFFLSREAKTAAYGKPGTGEAGARVQAYKLEIDALKWILSKEYAKQYGDLLKLGDPEGKPLPPARREITAEEIAVLERVRAARDKVAKGNADA